MRSQAQAPGLGLVQHPFHGEPRDGPRWTRSCRLGRLLAMPAPTAPAGIDPERRMVSDE